MKTFLCENCGEPLTDAELMALSLYTSTITCSLCGNHKRSNGLYAVPNPIVIDLITGKQERFRKHQHA